MLVSYNVGSSQEVVRFASYSLSARIEKSTNVVSTKNCSSDVSVISKMRHSEYNILPTL